MTPEQETELLRLAKTSVRIQRVTMIAIVVTSVFIIPFAAFFSISVLSNRF